MRSFCRFETGEGVPTDSMLSLISAWLNKDESTAEPDLQIGKFDSERLRAELAQERKEHEALQALYAEVVKHRNDMREVMEGLYVEVQVLSKEIQALRLQSSASTLTSGEARLLSEIADALGVPAEKGLLGVLQRVRDNLASAGLLGSPDGKDGDREA